MASKNQVTLEFAGDSAKLEKAFDNVGASSKTMSDDVGSASRTMRSEAGGSFDRVGEAADQVDTKAMGFRDTMTGVQDTMKGVGQIASGNLFEGFLNLGMGVGDLASGMFNLLIPSLKSVTNSIRRAGAATKVKTVAMLASTRAGAANAATTVRQTAATAAHRVATLASAAATKVMTVAQRALNLAMRMNPIGIIITVIAGLVAAIVVLWKKNEGFRNFFIAAWNKIKGAAMSVWNWIKNNWKNILAILTGPIGIAVRLITANWGRIKNGARTVVSAVKGFFAGVGNAIAAPFRSAFAGIRSAWNSTVGGRGFTIPGWVPGLGGRSFRIPTLHQGGIVPGAPGSETLALLEAGERVIPAGRSGQVVTVQPSFEVRVFIGDRELTDMVDVRISESNRGLRRAVRA